MKTDHIRSIRTTPRQPKPLTFTVTKDPRYATQRWKKYSKKFRALNPICAVTGLVTPSAGLVVDHVIPIEQGGSFWDIRNHQPLRKSIHNSKSSKEKHGNISAWVLNEEGEKIPKEYKEYVI